MTGPIHQTWSMNNIGSLADVLTSTKHTPTHRLYHFHLSDHLGLRPRLAFPAVQLPGLGHYPWHYARSLHHSRSQ
jgi:hypothetical protein